MFRHIRPVWAEINLDNIAYNMQRIRERAKSRDIIGIVKADAYGHGAVDVAPVILKNGANRLAVAVLSEAVELRKAGIDSPIMILGYTPLSIGDDIFKYDIEQTVFTVDYAEELSKMAQRRHASIKIHIALDTGMGRIGFIPNEKSVEDVYTISKLPGIKIEGLFTHFSTADEENKDYTYLQFERYKWFYNELTKKGVNINIRHVANSAAIMELPETHFEASRPGIIIYGYYPSNEVDKSRLDLKPAMELKTNVVHIKEMEVGDFVSYGRKFECKRKTLIATLPVGYADGYTRALSNKAKVIINGKFANVVGRICMDQCMVDVTDIPNVKVGDEVVLMGESQGKSITADDIAEILGTINYEVICMISKRVPRVYISGEKVVKIRNYV